MNLHANVPLQDWIGRTSEAEDIVTARLLASFHATFAPHAADLGGAARRPACTGA